MNYTKTNLNALTKEEIEQNFKHWNKTCIKLIQQGANSSNPEYREAREYEEFFLMLQLMGGDKD